MEVSLTSNNRNGDSLMRNQECEDGEFLINKDGNSGSPNEEMCGSILTTDSHVQSSNGAGFKEAEVSELLYKEVANDDEAYKLYNDYAFRCGFGIRKDVVSYRGRSGIVRQRIFVCSREGKKKEGDRPKVYTKLETRIECQARVQFDVDKGTGVYRVVKHDMVHNHAMVDVNQRHLIRSHRKVTKEQLEMINNLRNSGVGVADAVRVLRNESGGTANLGFTQQDAYDAVRREDKKKLDGCDSNQLIKYFSQRQAEHADFYYDIQLNEENELINFFWRDGRMKKDYDCFGDLVVHDTTYRTNKYDMICAPFVGMNHHNNNVMFGVGFILRENTESFVWLFNSFLKSMGHKHPVTIMTDQSLAMAKAIPMVFPHARHRLCTWHITENSKKNIRALRALDGFTDMFNTVLKYTDTEAEFEHYWKCMMGKYNCWGNAWLSNLYKLKEMFSPAYSKKYFLGGVLSSQRSESTNHSLGNRLTYTQGLCDFYKVFVDVVDEWRDKENSYDYKTMNGNRYLAFAEVDILLHAKKIYTVALYQQFEENFIKSTSCCQMSLKDSEPPFVKYHVNRPKKDLVVHTVSFNPLDLSIECTCNYFGEMGLLCCHSLRIYHVNNVCHIPKRYILGRWTKQAMCTRVHDDKKTDQSVLQASVWRVQAVRECIGLINSIQHDSVVRERWDIGIKELRKMKESLMGETEENISLEEVENMLHPKIKDPPKKRKKGSKDVRPKSIVEKESNKLKGWKKRAEKATTINKKKAQASVQDYFDLPPNGILAHPTSSSTLLDVYIPDDYFGVNIVA